MMRIMIVLDERENMDEMLTAIGKDIKEGNTSGRFGGEWKACFYDTENIGE